ncbi:MAG: right-handed parallel beta-helix repeat-containing protein [Candidatus Omnitrophica bacterium]|nr:right-handed parallel beta-helix repeat-containing protein [Candidatus Omnitrophota bacterium]
MTVTNTLKFRSWLSAPERLLIGIVFAGAICGYAAGSETIDASKYATIQEAFDAVPEGGGLVKLPAGVFEIDEPLTLAREDVRVEGCGAATHIVNKNAQGKPALILQPKDYQADNRARIWRIQLADFRISGSTESGDGILAQGVNEIYIHGLSIDHNGGNGINLIDCYEDPRISDSIITYNAQTGLNLHRCHDIVVNANQFEENLDAVRCIDSFNLCMNGNNLDDHLRHGVVIENTYGSVLSGNMIEECNGIAVIMDRDCYGNTVSANVIAHNSGGGVDLRDAWGCAISANTFTINARQSITVGPGSGRITITGNNISNAHIGGKTMRDDPTGGLLLQRTCAVTVTGNIFSGNWKEAVRSEGKCKEIVLTGNILLDGSRSQPGEFPAFDLESAQIIQGDNLVVPNRRIQETLQQQK